MNSPLETKFQVAILAETHGKMDGLTHVASIEWLRSKQTGVSSFDFYRDDAIISSVNLESGSLDLQHLLGMVVVGSKDTFEAIEREWKSRLPSISLAFRWTPEWDTKSILGAAIDCIAEDLSAQRFHSGRASLELATYRREFDRLQRSFTRLEEYVVRQSYPAMAEVFEYPPESEGGKKKDRRVQFDGNAGPAGSFLTQYLPVDSLGISSFSIYVNAVPDAGGEPLRASLRAIETGTIFGTWSIDAGETRVGWVELALERAIDGPALSLSVDVEFPAGKSGWALALGPPHPYREFCASTGSSESLKAPIALRLFRSLPGVRVTPTTSAIRTIDAPRALAEFVPYDAYGKISQVLPELRDNNPTLVFFDPDIGCLTVHPRMGGLTVARMNLSVPKNAWGISARICLAHERASQTEFGLMICVPRDDKKGLAELNQLALPSPSFSGWKAVLPLETKSVSVVFASTPEDELSIYLLTRQAPESSPDFAWARFSKLEFLVLPQPLRQCT